MALNRVMPQSLVLVGDRHDAVEQRGHARRRRTGGTCRCPTPGGCRRRGRPGAARSQKSSTVRAATGSSRVGSIVAITLRPISQKLAIDHRCTELISVPGPVPGPDDLLDRHRRVDRPHHLRVAQERLAAPDDDVGGHRDELRAVRRALGGERPGDRAVVGDEPVGLGLARRIRSARATSATEHPLGAEQSSSTSVPSAGTSSSTQAMMHGTWNSRLTMPMWLRGVPPVHTTPVSSWKIGARNVAPASRTRAMTPSAPVSISSSTSGGPFHAPSSGPAPGAWSKTFSPADVSHGDGHYRHAAVA